MAKSGKKGSEFGCVYYREDRNRWIVQYYEYHPITQKKIHKKKVLSLKKKLKNI